MEFDFGAILVDWRMLAKGEDPLKAKVNEIIANAKKDGTLDAMAKKWLGRPAGDLPV